MFTCDSSNIRQKHVTCGAAGLEGVRDPEEKEVLPFALVLRPLLSLLALLSFDDLLSACLSATMADTSACNSTRLPSSQQATLTAVLPKWSDHTIKQSDKAT